MGSAIDRVRVLYYACEDGDRRVAARLGVETLKPMALQVKRYPCLPGQRYVAGLTAHLAGVAVVCSGADLLAVGTGPSLSFWQWPYSMAAAAEALDLLGPLDTPSRAVHSVRAARVPVLRIQHRIAELCPALRIWEPGPVEVMLRPYDGGQLVGGVVWPQDYYHTGQAAADAKSFNDQSRSAGKC